MGFGAMEIISWGSSPGINGYKHDGMVWEVFQELNTSDSFWNIAMFIFLLVFHTPPSSCFVFFVIKDSLPAAKPRWLITDGWDTPL